MAAEEMENRSSCGQLDEGEEDRRLRREWIGRANNRHEIKIERK